MSRPTGPNVKRLIIHKMSLIIVPPGSGFDDVIRFLSNKNMIISAANEATDWVFKAIDFIKNTTNQDDETIAGTILEAIEKKPK